MLMVLGLNILDLAIRMIISGLCRIQFPLIHLTSTPIMLYTIKLLVFGVSGSILDQELTNRGLKISSDELAGLSNAGGAIGSIFPNLFVGNSNFNSFWNKILSVKNLSIFSKISSFFPTFFSSAASYLGSDVFWLVFLCIWSILAILWLVSDTISRICVFLDIPFLAPMKPKTPSNSGSISTTPLPTPNFQSTKTTNNAKNTKNPSGSEGEKGDSRATETPSESGNSFAETEKSKNKGGGGGARKRKNKGGKAK